MNDLLPSPSSSTDSTLAVFPATRKRAPLSALSRETVTTPPDVETVDGVTSRISTGFPEPDPATKVRVCSNNPSVRRLPRTPVKLNSYSWPAANALSTVMSSSRGLSGDTERLWGIDSATSPSPMAFKSTYGAYSDEAPSKGRAKRKVISASRATWVSPCAGDDQTRSCDRESTIDNTPYPSFLVTAKIRSPSSVKRKGSLFQAISTWFSVNGLRRESRGTFKASSNIMPSDGRLIS